MGVVISLLRGVNVGGHHKIKMDALRSLYESLELRSAQTCIQSGNVVFGTKERNLARLAKRIEDAIEQQFGFRPAVIVRTSSQLSEVIANNPFAKRRGIEPAKLVVDFLASDPDPEAGDRILQIKTDPEELRLSGRELYIYFPNGMARSKLPWAAIDKVLKTPGTARNWNTVTKLLQIAKSMEASR
jgi:uncharacterized protein (DUF1697 family)